MSQYYRDPVLQTEIIIITGGVGSVSGRWRHPDAITQPPADQHHSCLKCQIKDSSKERKCLWHWLSNASTNDFVNFTVCGLSFKFANLISVNCWINFILPTNCWTNGLQLEKWMSELYTWQNCSVWCKKCVENLEHDFEILCKKRLLHGQLKLNCTKCDKVMQWKVRFKTSLFTTSQKVMFEQKKRKKNLVQFDVLNIGYCQHKRFWHTLTKKFRIV